MSVRNPSQPSAFRHFWYYAKDGFRMLVYLLLPLIVFLFSPLHSVEIGDGESSVLAELGPPTGKMLSEGITILTYSNGSVRIRDGVVVGVTGVYDKNKKSVIQDAAGRLLAADGSVEIPLAAPDGLSLDDEALSLRKDETRSWKLHYVSALKLSRERDLPMLLLFCDASPTSQRMEKALSDPLFIQGADLDYVLLKVSSNSMNRWSLKQYDMLVSRYGVKAFPTILIVGKDDVEIARSGFVEGNAKTYLGLIKKMVAVPLATADASGIPAQSVPVVTEVPSTPTSPSEYKPFLTPRLLIHLAAVLVFVVVWFWSRRSPH
ncbi:MAG: hypothetical protein PHF70_04385 [Opitutales bacterium]|nr:hypothetical protein [Opitutales bacterium]